MPDINVIADVSRTMVDVLNRALEAGMGASDPQTAPLAVVHDLHQPPKPAGDHIGVLAVTLVEAREDPSARNRPPVRKPNPDTPGRVEISKPPMACQLRYLLTPWVSDTNDEQPSKKARETEHKMLGIVAQRFYDDPMLSRDDFTGVEPSNDTSLEGSAEILKITLEPLTFEEQTRFWHSVQQKYRASLTYDVRVVNIDPVEKQDLARVTSREIQYGAVPGR